MSHYNIFHYSICYIFRKDKILKFFIEFNNQYKPDMITIVMNDRVDIIMLKERTIKRFFKI